MNPPVLLDTDTENPELLWQRVCSEFAAGCPVVLAGMFIAPLATKFGTKHSGAFQIPIEPHAPQSAWLFRLRDIFLASLALLVLFPFMVMLALAVKLTSPGPVLYTATVVGLGRKPFVWRKFRSMHPAPAGEEQVARREQFRAFVLENRHGKVIDTARVTRLGRFLRKYSLDELPQLWNVLTGEMSLVGPRPCLAYEAEFIPAWAAPRFEVRPGLTGVWQLAGRGRVTFMQSLAMDLYYYYAHSFRLDLMLIAQTFWVLLRGEGE